MLDREVAKYLTLNWALPITLISTGGFVAVSHFRNRRSTEDIDYMLDPKADIDNRFIRKIVISTHKLIPKLNSNNSQGPSDDIGIVQQKILQKLAQAVKNVASNKNLSPDWMAHNVDMFAAGQKEKERLFKESKEQNIVLWKSPSLIIYAALWEWSLALKLKRLSSHKILDGSNSSKKPTWSHKRMADLSDAVILLHKVIKKRNLQQITRQFFNDLSQYIFIQIQDDVIEQVKTGFINRYGNNIVYFEAL